MKKRTKPQPAKPADARDYKFFVRCSEQNTYVFDLGRGEVEVKIEMRNKVPTLRVRSPTHLLLVLPDFSNQIGVVVS